MQEALQELKGQYEAVERDIEALIESMEKGLQEAEPKSPKQINI